MRLLLDTHTLIWAVDSPANLSATATTALQDPANELWIGAGTLWEMGIKVGQKKLGLSRPYRAWMTQAIADLGLKVLPITLDHADTQAGLPLDKDHKDPFDRLLAAQAIVEGVPLVTVDDKFDRYPITRLW